MTNEDRDDIRPEVVQAIMDAWLEADPSRLEQVLHELPVPSLGELMRANEGIGQVYIARAPDGPRLVEMWDILATTRFATPGHELDADGIWSALTDVQRDRLVELYDVLPTEALREVVDRYRADGEPS